MSGRGRDYTAAVDLKRHVSIKGLVLREGEGEGKEEREFKMV